MKLSQKILPLAMSALLAFQAVPVYAAVPSSSRDTSAKTLTVKEAATKAITYTESLRKTKEELPISKERYAELWDSRLNATSESAWLSIVLQLMQMDISYAANLSSVEAMEENIEYSVMSLFAAIINAEKELELYNESIDLKSRDLSIMKTKVDLGLTSQLDYDLAQSEYENMINTRMTKQNVIDSAYRTLNSTMGQKLENKYTIELDFEYEELGKVNLTTHVSKFVNRSISVKTAQENVKVAEYDLSQVGLTYNPQTFEVSKFDTEKMEKEAAVAQAKRAVQTAKDNVETTIKDTYSDIIDMETTYKNTLLSVEDMYKKLEVMEVQFELGQITQLEIDNYKYAIKEAEEGLRKLVVNHEMAKIRFNSPNLLVNGS